MKEKRENHYFNTKESAYYFTILCKDKYEILFYGIKDKKYCVTIGREY